MLSILLSRLRTLNVFASSSTANNEYELENERISTRIFIVLLTFCLLILFVYTGQVSVTQTIEVKHLSYERFQSLALNYPQTLRCSCANVSISYKSFIHLEPQFHQLCLSDFISSDWIKHIGSAADLHMSEDFSYIGGLFFLTLTSFCRRANDTWINALQTFDLSQFITAQILMEDVFTEQIDVIIQSFESSIELKYYQAFNLIQFSIQVNRVLSGLFTNAQLEFDPVNMYLPATPRLYDNDTCDCDVTYTCVMPLTLQDRRTNQSDSLSLFTIPGLFIGCYLVEAVRQSSLECFYQKSCITTIEQFLQAPVVLNNSVLPLNPSIKSRFNVSSAVDQLLSKAMTEEWKKNVSYAEYFTQCDVSSCIYSFSTKFNIVYIITTLIGLIGGLTKIFRIIIPRVVKFIRRRYVPAPIITNNSNGVHRSLLERLRNVNCFSKPSAMSNEIEIKQQLIATRLFFILLIVSITILISYYGTERVTNLYDIERPSFEQFNNLQFDQQSNPSFSCPCSTLTMSYEKFIEIHYALHPLCSSDFVQHQWLDQLRFVHGDVPDDFRSAASSIFISLGTLCKASADQIENSLTSFNESLFIANQMLDLETFIIKTNTTVDTFKSTMTRSFARNLALTSNMTQNNALMSKDMTNFLFVVDNANPPYSISYDYAIYIIPSGDEFVPCSCAYATHCYKPLSVYYSFNDTSDIPLWSPPGLFFDCLINYGILYSTLICLFNQSCVDSMSFWLNTTSVNAIDVLNLVHFDSNSTVNVIVNDLFIDQWNHSTSYRAFYEQCHPDRCTYTLSQHKSFWLILTTIFGLIGGLIKILQLVVPHLIHSLFILYSRYRSPEHNQTIPETSSSVLSFQLIINRLRQFNYFSSDDQTTDDEREIQGQIIATRLFLFFLLFSLIILTIYSSQVQVTKTVTIANPSLEQYTSLYENYSQTLNCPCENIDIPLQTFITIRPTYHQVCESSFVNSEWLNGLLNITFNMNLYTRDFRFLGGTVFATIRSLCQLSFTSSNDGLLDFNKSTFLTVQIIPENQLVNEGQSLIDAFISTSENSFVNSLQTVRDTTQANVLLSGLATSTSVRIDTLNGTNVKMAIRAKVYNTSCSCYDDPTCAEPAGLYIYPGKILIYSIPGFLIGCYMVEATLKSNLFPLYNQSWINDFRARIQFDYYNSIPFNTTALNSSLDSQYNITTPINIMMEKMMTESWNPYVNYSAYYEQCHPIECKHTYVVKFDVVYIVTTIIALIGGLLTILQLVIPRAVKLIQGCWFELRSYTTNQVTPAT